MTAFVTFSTGKNSELISCFMIIEMHLKLAKAGLSFSLLFPFIRSLVRHSSIHFRFNFISFSTRAHTMIGSDWIDFRAAAAGVAVLIVRTLAESNAFSISDFQFSGRKISHSEDFLSLRFVSQLTTLSLLRADGAVASSARHQMDVNLFKITYFDN